MTNNTSTHQSNNDALQALTVLRQAFVIASVLIISGLILALTVHPYFSVLPFLVSGGLMFSGIVGWCPMIFILERMPWNR